MTPRAFDGKSERDLIIIAITEIDAIKDDLRRGAETMSDHEQRLRIVEQRQCPNIPRVPSIKSIAVTVSAIMAAFWGLVELINRVNIP